ncbi:MAG: hypothetical protein COW70_08780 [Hydrogenophilales bacterium CG18_big_fil_WC_8_21_14_2_50_58_12]|nr:MAG: hypothetical protein COW70_08780 [Hydrogenophilales bacterium CG18_big_fil_WC_8_21_14_2_50_58_12]
MLTPLVMLRFAAIVSVMSISAEPTTPPRKAQTNISISYLMWANVQIHRRSAALYGGASEWNAELDD